MILSGGIISGARGRRFEEHDARALLIAGGLQGLGVREGDCVCILMRNDIAFLETSYAVMTLGGYAVPVNWHFKPEEINGSQGKDKLCAKLLNLINAELPDGKLINVAITDIIVTRI